jgi:hypothetical protein
MAKINTIRNAMRAQPFRPFDLVLADGTSFPVRHPDYLSVPPVQHPREVEYFEVIIDRGGDDYEYRSRWFDLNLISEVVIPSDEAIRFRPGPPRVPPAGPGPQTQSPQSDG